MNNTLDFLYIGTTGQPIDNQVIEYFKSPSCCDTFYKYSEFYHYNQPSNSGSLFVYGNSDKLANSIASTPDQVVLIDGYIHDESLIDTARSVLDPHKDPSRWFEGIYCILCINKVEESVSLLTDYYAQYPLFYGKKGATYALSNNPHLVARAINGPTTPPKKDELAFAWILACGNMGDNRTGYHGVLRIEPKIFIKANNISLSFQNRPIIDFPIFDSIDNGVDHLSSILLKNVLQIASKHDGRISSQLTGGYDSRAVLSLLMRAGLESNTTFYTSGFEEHEDVIVARMLQSHYKLNLIVQTPQPKAIAEDYLHSLTRHVWLTAGFIGLYDRLAVPNEDAWRYPAQLDGLAGECLSSHYFKGDLLSIVKNNPESAKYYMLGFNEPRELLSKDALSYCLDYMDKDLINSESPQDILTSIDFYFVKRRMRSNHTGLRWKNISCPANIYSPLYSAFGTYLALQDSGRRQMHNIHYQLIGRAGEELITIPLAGKEWDKNNLSVGSAKKELLLPGPVIARSSIRRQDVEIFSGLDTLLEVVAGAEGLFWILLNRRKVGEFIDRISKQEKSSLALVDRQVITNLAGIALSLRTDGRP